MEIAFLRHKLSNKNAVIESKIKPFKNEILNRNICSCKTSSIEFSLENIENNKKPITIKMNSSIIKVNGSSN